MFKKFVVIFTLICIIVNMSTAAPLDEDDEGKELVHPNRVKRATCDLLSVQAFGASVGHAACAAHCLAMRGGRKGGYCSQKGVCICRF